MLHCNFLYSKEKLQTLLAGTSPGLAPKGRRRHSPSCMRMKPALKLYIHEKGKYESPSTRITHTVPNRSVSEERGYLTTIEMDRWIFK